jgi:hypothetical protein
MELSRQRGRILSPRTVTSWSAGDLARENTAAGSSLPLHGTVMRAATVLFEARQQGYP